MTNKGSFNLKAYLLDNKAVVEAFLEPIFREHHALADDLTNAMAYSLFAGGKRLRPVLCIAGAESVGGKNSVVLPVACAIELIHTYSLIHDDLPVMDDDDLRRGKPTNHKVFGEAMAVLAGDGLLTEAFRLMTQTETTDRLSATVLVEVIGLIARAAGYQGMVGGQAVDMAYEGKAVDFSVAEFIHTHKTGALIAASVTAGAMLGGGSPREIQAVNSYGCKVGLAFQISDDILDVEGDTATMGKLVGSDEQRKKITYPAVMGLEKSKEMQTQLVHDAVQCLSELDQKADPLRHMARYIIERNR